MLIVGIAGGTGSGKTTVVRKVMEVFPNEEVIVIPQDSYYKDNGDISLEEPILLYPGVAKTRSGLRSLFRL